jgi:hypothetical protein
MKAYQDIIPDFIPVSLKEMDAVRLMNRVDTKYVFLVPSLAPLLEGAKNENYRMLRIGDVSHFSYNSLYFDTKELRFYHEHHNGVRPRSKVRFREYIHSGEVFLEIKQKSNRERTRKSRRRVDAYEPVLSPASMQYLLEKVPGLKDPLLPSITVRFNRMTLISPGENERITIDTDIGFLLDNDHQPLPTMVICEVKRSSQAGISAFMTLLKKNHIYATNISKYCLGTILLRRDVKANRFKRYILSLNKMGYESTAHIPAGR